MYHAYLGLCDMPQRKTNPEQFIYCMLCGWPIREPRLLQCTSRGDKHAFCRQCLEDYIKQEAKVNLPDQDKNEFFCPTCRNVTHNSDVKLEYPSNHQAKAIHQHVKLTLDNERYRDVCQECATRSSQKKVKKKCSNCEKELCSKCSEKHKDLSHSLVALPDCLSLTCKPHRQSITAVCVKCTENDRKDKLMCDKCSDHRSTEASTTTHNVSALRPHARKKQENLQSQLRQLEEAIRKKHDKMEQLKTLDKKHRNELKKVENTIDRQAHFMIREIEERKGQLKEELNARHDEALKMIQQQKEYLEFHICATQRLTNLVKQLLREGQDFQLFSNYDELRIRADTVTTDKSCVGNISDRAFSDAQVTYEFTSKQDRTLGSLKQKRLEVSSTSQQPSPQASIIYRRDDQNTSVSSGRDRNTSQKPMPTGTPEVKSSPQLIKKINDPVELHVDYDSKLKPKGLTFLPDSCLVLAFSDAEYLMMYNKLGEPVSKITEKDVRIFPNDVAYIGNGQLLVSDGNSKLIKVFMVPEEGDRDSVQRPRALSHKFHEPFGIACDHDKNNKKETVLVTDVMKHNVTVLDLITGKHIRSWGKHGRKGNEFNCPEFIAVDTQHIVWVSDRENHCIKAFDMKGSIKNIVAGPHILNQPGGLVIDHHGNILVADGGNNRIMLVLRDNSGHRAVVSGENIQWPYGLALSNEGNIAITRRADTLVALYSVYMDMFDATTAPDLSDRSTEGDDSCSVGGASASSAVNTYM